jgi:class 3 adenylate cyclase
MASKRPIKVKASIQKMRGVERDRAMHAEELIINKEYARESADLLAYVTFPLDDDVTTTKEFAKEVNTLSMDVSAFAETSSSEEAVDLAAGAVLAFRNAAAQHNEAHYIRKLDLLLAEVPSIQKRFGS